MAADTTTYRVAATGAELAAALAAAGFEVAPPRPVTEVVLDTFDGRLAAAGTRLTADVSGRPVALVLRAGDGADAALTVPGVPAVAADLPPGPLRARLAELLDVRVLRPLLTTTATRADAVRRDPGGKILVRAAVVDSVCTGGTAVDGTFAEVVGLAGYADHAGRARRQIEALGAEAEGGDLAGLVAAAAGVDLGGVRVEPGVPLDAGARAVDGYRAVLANLRDAVVVNRPGTIDDVDPEFLHDLRVAVRRTRAVLGHARAVLPPEPRARARAEFAWLGQATSAARDLDVYQIEWPVYVADLPAEVAAELEPVRAHLAADRVVAHTELADELGGRRTDDLLAWWGEWLDETPAHAALGRRGAEPLGSVVAGRIRRAHRQMVGDGRRITPASPATDLHELRKDAKKLRYLVECFGGLYAPAARAPFVKRLKAMQDNLGEHQDAEVHAHQLGELAGVLGGAVPVATVMAMGRLVERMEQRRAAARAEFAERFADFDSAGTRHDLAALLSPGGDGS